MTTANGREPMLPDERTGLEPLLGGERRQTLNAIIERAIFETSDLGVAIALVYRRLAALTDVKIETDPQLYQEIVMEVAQRRAEQLRAKE